MKYHVRIVTTGYSSEFTKFMDAVAETKKLSQKVPQMKENIYLMIHNDDDTPTGKWYRMDRTTNLLVSNV